MGRRKEQERLLRVARANAGTVLEWCVFESWLDAKFDTTTPPPNFEPGAWSDPWEEQGFGAAEDAWYLTLVTPASWKSIRAPRATPSNGIFVSSKSSS